MFSFQKCKSCGETRAMPDGAEECAECYWEKAGAREQAKQVFFTVLSVVVVFYLTSIAAEFLK